MSEVRIAAEPRTEFGKGAARRTRRAGKVPAVLYGHGTDPQHISLPGHDLMLALKTPNVLLTIEGLAGEPELALPKDVQRDPIKGFLEHVDLLLVKRGEKVVVDLPVNLVGDVVAGGVVQQEVIQVSVEAEATHIPQAVDLSIEGLVVGTQVLAGDLKLPSGVTLMLDAEALILQIADATVSAGVTEAAAEGEAAEAAEEAPAGAEAGESAE